jgi:hypothetical protein
VPCILQRNCQRSVVSFQTLPETTAKPSYNPYPFSRFKQWSRPSKRSPVAGGRSQAAGRALTAFNQADLACSGNAWYVGESSISIATRGSIQEWRRRGGCGQADLIRRRDYISVCPTLQLSHSYVSRCCGCAVLHVGGPESLRGKRRLAGAQMHSLKSRKRHQQRV